MPQNTWVCVFLPLSDDAVTQRDTSASFLVLGFPQHVPENPGDNGTLLTIVREMKRLIGCREARGHWIPGWAGCRQGQSRGGMEKSGYWERHLGGATWGVMTLQQRSPAWLSDGSQADTHNYTALCRVLLESWGIFQSWGLR